MTLSTKGMAQWKPLFTHEDQFQVIYFLDLPGPPKIGFLGNFDSLFKTTDGGNSWKTIVFNFPSIPFPGVWDFTDITFKGFCDRMGLLRQESCFKTTDCGESWVCVTQDTDPIIEWSIYYDNQSGGLLSFSVGSVDDEISWDEGTTWQQFWPDPFEFFGWICVCRR